MSPGSAAASSLSDDSSASDARAVGPDGAPPTRKADPQVSVVAGSTASAVLGTTTWRNPRLASASAPVGVCGPVP